MSLIKELQRRNVFRVAIAYIVTAWLMLQIADVLLNNLDAPPWLFAGLLIVLAMGFVFSVIFAWVYELTPEGLRREHEVARNESITAATGRKLDYITIGLLLVAIGFVMAENVFFSRETPHAKTRAPPPPPFSHPAEPDARSIAVLPFVDMSPDGDQEYIV